MINLPLDKKVKKLLLIFAFLAGGIGAGIVVFLFWFKNPPYNLRITNQTGRSATISWLTKKPTQGCVVWSSADEKKATHKRCDQQKKIGLQL